jgi:RHH-type proline utilization regulon transcriptional repressor/proline dehydrogenase/delta 1-pyrroline-5-carboxylate dehydrogenase
MAARSPLGARVELPGPVGERNVYALRRRGLIAAHAESATGLRLQLAAILATGNDAAVPAMLAAVALQGLPAELKARVTGFDDPLAAPGLAGALIEGEGETVSDAARRLSARPGPILRAAALSHAELAAGEDYPLGLLIEERSISTNIAAAGGNASLMTIG